MISRLMAIPAFMESSRQIVEEHKAAAVAQRRDNPSKRENKQALMAEARAMGWQGTTYASALKYDRKLTRAERANG